MALTSGKKLKRLVDTLRWLRLRQITSRIRRYFSTAAVADAIDVGIRSECTGWQQPARRIASFDPDGTPRFLNQSGSIESPEDWNKFDVSRLWLYNLHYFDDLNAKDSVTRRGLHAELIDRWIKENPAPLGTGWEPYPCSLRIVNWIKWVLAGNEMLPLWQLSLAIQADWLSKNLEWHLLGNHLFANAKALVLAGHFFEGPSADNWLETGQKILEREVPEQILADGGQFERSPMYHVIALEDVLDLINIAECTADRIDKSVVSSWRNSAERMLAWLKLMMHPDGEIALLNDSSIGVAPPPDEVDRYARRLGISSQPEVLALTHFKESGYVRAASECAVLFCDVGEIGPDYLPGHAHADTLSFELSLFGDRWIVDTGCSTYEASEERLRQRGTAAHNTVVVDGEDSSEVWSSFRVARRARPVDVAASSENGHIRISGGHDGYMRLKGRVMHYREFLLNDDQLQIVDDLTGELRSAVANFLLHPDIAISLSENGFDLSRGQRRASFSFNGGKAEIVDATWHPEFGLSIPTHRISVTIADSTLTTTLRWESIS